MTSNCPLTKSLMKYKNVPESHCGQVDCTLALSGLRTPDRYTSTSVSVMH